MAHLTPPKFASFTCALRAFSFGVIGVAISFQVLPQSRERWTAGPQNELLTAAYRSPGCRGSATTW
jgi:hypothetical protein